ncbi:MAG: hypothetical protein HFI37_01220 [Lachnospiraceae bacterium]|nr:hypothetical protein [Lachnospiraceae bacterium]
MKEKISFSKRVMRTVTIFLFLFLISLLGNIPGTTVRAAGQQSKIDNPTYTLTSTKGTAVSTKANPNETTVLIFGHTGCGYTRSTLNSISSCDWVKRSDIRVIFVDTKFHTQEEVLAYEEGYQCPDMIFCHDEDGDNFIVMAEYARLFGISRSSYPTTVLIDKNNKLQNCMTGAKTANEILTEIEKFTEIDGGGSTQPPSSPDTDIENFAYGLKTIDNTTVSTKANPNETTVLIFGSTDCGYTKATLQDIDKSNWVGRSDIRVMFADSHSATLSETAAFAKNYSSKEIIFCHDQSNLNYKFALSYLALDNKACGTFPYIILIDKNNKVRNISLGFQTADEIIAEINKFMESSDSSDPEPTPTPGISNVSGLKASSSTKSVKLTWKKVSKAKGYMIYQYNSSKKTWVKKKTLKTNTTSYTIKDLAPGTSYRFAVKAYIQTNGKQVNSKSYTSLYTATKPNAVRFKVTAGRKKATVKWNKVKGATGYTVYYKTSAKGSWKKLKTTKSTSYTKKKLKSRKTYIFTVKAYKTYKGKTYTSSFSSKKVKIK